jgi:hypothetical protein
MANLKLKFTTGYNTDDLTAYVDQNKSPLYTSAVYGGETMSKLSGSIMTGVKSKEQINYMDIDAILSGDSGCGTQTASGEVYFPIKEVEVGKVGQRIKLCPSDLETFYTQKFLPTGSYYEELPFNTELMARYTEKMAQVIETKIWQETTDFDGFIKTIEATTDVVLANASTGGWTPITSGTGITASNIMSILYRVVEVVPTSLFGNPSLEIFLEPKHFNSMLIALTNANLFHFAVEKDAYTKKSTFIPAFGLTVTALPGLVGTDRIICSRLENYVIATDETSDYDAQVRVFYDEDSELINIRLKAKFGTQIKFGSELVYFKLA